MEATPGDTGRARPDPSLIAARARNILDVQIAGLRGLFPLIEKPALADAVARLLDCKGRILVVGVGKSGIVASKIAASMRSTGVPAVYLHPVDAVHGDVGLITPGDLGLFLSKSGESRELIELVPTFKRLQVPLLAVVCRADSTLGRLSDLVLETGPIEEAGPLEEIPTTSTTVFQVLGDILTLLVVWERGLTTRDFAFLHPGGVLGRLTTVRVREALHQADGLPRVDEQSLLREALVEIIDKRLGMTTVVDAAGRLTGILTDGDIRRTLHRYASVEGLKVLQVMTREPKTIDGDQLLSTAVAKMETNPGGPITSLIVIDGEGRPVGVLHLHDCLRLGLRNGV